LLSTLILVVGVPLADAEILAMLNYQAKPGQAEQKEGLAIIDVDPTSSTFGNMLMDIPLPAGLVSHHIYYNQDKSKAYITALGKNLLHVLDLTRFPYRMKAVEVPGCAALEDLAFSDDNRRWYLTCMGSDNVMVGDATTDALLKPIAAHHSEAAFIRYPHGISIHKGIDRMLVTSTVRPSDFGDPGESVTVVEVSTGKVLSTHKVSNKPSPSKAAPVEVKFVPNAVPPVAIITNMFEETLWVAIWNPNTKAFAFKQVDDFTTRGHKMPLGIEFDRAARHLYVTTASPGHVTRYDITDPQNPVFLDAISAAPGAHHTVFSPDEKYLFVQNNMLSLPGISDGSISVIDLAQGKSIASVDTLKTRGLDPNSIVLLPVRP
jgi:DNA-binding beta-propeller fold protein YncE